MAEMSVSEVIDFLKLIPLNDEGGYYRQTWLSSDKTENGRSAGSAIYYLLTREKSGFSALHKLPTDEIYHFYGGSPVELSIFSIENVRADKIILGNRLDKGEIPQFTVPAGCIQGSRICSGQWALVGCTMSPAYNENGFELTDPDKLMIHFPGYRKIIKELSRNKNN